ncbi:MAG: PD-(D/E)XK nuclease family protein [Candidatus Binatia bacterium]
MTTVEHTLSCPLRRVAEHLENIPQGPGRRAVVLVPAERHAHAIRRYVCVERAHPAHLAGVLFLPPVEFARELLLRAGTVRRPGWEAVRRLRILQLFASETLGAQLRYFKATQLCSGRGYGDAFARTIAELEASGLDVPGTHAVARQLAREDQRAADRLHDVAVIWQAADAGAGTRATGTQVLAAASALVVTRPQVLAPFGPILSLLTASPSTVLLRFLVRLPSCRIVVQEARPMREGTQRWRPLLDPGTPADPASAADEQHIYPTGNDDSPALLPVAASELHLARRFLFELPETLTHPDRPRSRGPDGSVDVEEYPSVEDEVEAAATWVTEQIADGIPIEQIALVVPDIDPYGMLLGDRVARISGDAETPRIRAYVAGGLSLAVSPAGMRVQAFLHALARGLEAEATIRLLPLLRRGGQPPPEAGERLSLSRTAEIVYGAGIVGGSPGDHGGLNEWLPRLQRCREAMRAVADTPPRGPDGTGDGPAQRLAARKQHEAARWLRDVEPILPGIAVLQDLAAAVATGAPLYATWSQCRAFCDQWLRLPPDPANLLGLLDQRLQPILADPVASAIRGPAAVRVLMDLVRSERGPTARFGEPCIFVGTAAQAAGLSFTAVRVLGLAEGALPHTPHDDPIVPDSLRQRIEEMARAQQVQPDIVLPRLADHVLDDIQDVFRVVSGTVRRLALSVPRQWVDRSEREISGVLLEVATALGRRPADELQEGDVPSAARLRAAYLNVGCAARQHYARQHPLSPRALLTVALPTATAPGAASLAVPASWTGGTVRAVDQIRERMRILDSGALSSMDGVVGRALSTAQSPGLTVRRPISQSALTVLLSCPHRFLQERILYLRRPPTRPSTDMIAAAEYGSLFHTAAERFFQVAGEQLCRHEGTLASWVACACDIAAQEFDAHRHQYPMRTEEGLVRERSRLLRQIELLVRYEWDLPAREFLESELRFGDPEPLRLTLDGSDLFIWGAIDRVDRTFPPALSVRDLKTGRVRDFGEEPVNPRRDLQIGVYVLALESLGYGDAAVGTAAYVHPSAVREPDRAFTGARLDLLRQRTREWLTVARQLLSTGSFPRTPNPNDCTACPFVPACGSNAQLRSAAKLDNVPEGSPLHSFARFKRSQREDEGC